jgi:hypothetical protein
MARATAPRISLKCAFRKPRLSARRTAASVRRETPDWRQVAFMDADDIWSPGHLLEVRRLISDFPDARLVGTAHTESPLQDSMSAPVVKGERRVIRHFKAASRDIGVIWTSAAAVHRRTALSVGGFSGHDLGEDLELWARLALSYPVAVSSAVTALHVRGTGGAMDTAHKRGVHRDVLVRDLRELSTVIEALETKAHLVERRDLIAYLDSRIASAIAGRLMQGDSTGARNLRKLISRRWHPRLWLLQLLASAPEPVLRAALSARSAVISRSGSWA